MTTEVAELHRSVVKSIKRHSQEQQAKGGYEAVGFIAYSKRNKKAALGIATVPLHNHASNPQEAFFVEPAEQYRAEQKLHDEGYTILGVYHSHPAAEAYPSQSDTQLARPGELVFIYSVTFDDLRAYRELDGTLEPVEVVECP